VPPISTATVRVGNSQPAVYASSEGAGAPPGVAGVVLRAAGAPLARRLRSTCGPLARRLMLAEAAQLIVPQRVGRRNDIGDCQLPIADCRLGRAPDGHGRFHTP